MLVGLRKGRQPVKGISLTYSCGHPNLMPLGRMLGNRAIPAMG